MITGKEKDTEMIIVDDNSRDGSEEAVNKLAKKYAVRIIVRTTERGLSSAVLRGFDEATGDYLLCMDADLQHPPSSVPKLFRVFEPNSKSNTEGMIPEFVIGTRYGGQAVAIDKDWPLYRRIISSGARLLAYPLTPLSDPMTGFFALPRSVYKRANNVNPIGFKICMELYVKCGVQKHAEVPILFGVRTIGESKLSSKVIIGYLKHLKDLYWYRYPVALILLLLLLLIVLFKMFGAK